MFGNVGQKIKDIVRLLFVLKCIGSFILGAVIGMMVDNARYFGDNNLPAFFVFALVSVIGSLLSWLSSLLVYGYGELIDRAMSIDDKLSQVPSHSPTTDDEWQCACGKFNPFSTETCISCGRAKSDAKFSNEEN